MSSAQWAFGTRVSSISIMIMMTAMILTSMMTVKIFKDGVSYDCDDYDNYDDVDSVKRAVGTRVPADMYSSSFL